jgi:hypothetical protein
MLRKKMNGQQMFSFCICRFKRSRAASALQRKQHREKWDKAAASLAERYGSSQQPILSNLDQDLPAPFDRTRLMEQKDSIRLSL